MDRLVPEDSELLKPGNFEQTEHEFSPNAAFSDSKKEDSPKVPNSNQEEAQSQNNSEPQTDPPTPRPRIDGKDQNSVREVSAYDMAKIVGSYKTKTLQPFQGLPTENSESCPFDIKNLYNKNFDDIKPLLSSIRRDKFLINLTPFGPNNQLRGFRDTVLLAIYLNRTIILPPFFKHSSDPTQSRPGYFYQHPSEKINGELLAKLMPVMPFEKFAQACPNSISDALMSRKDSNVTEYKRLAMYQFIYKKQFLTPNYQNGDPTMMAKTHLAKPNAIGKNGQVNLFMSHSSVHSAYDFDNDHQCVMWLEPYRNMQFTPELEAWSKRGEPFGAYHGDNTSKLLMQKGELAARMILATGRPNEIKLAARKYILNEMRNRTFAAMHWRYDVTDFGNHCRKYNITTGICGGLNSGGIDAAKVAENLGDHLQNLNHAFLENFNHDSQRAPQIKAVYIAAPPKEAENINLMKSVLFTLGYKAYYGEDLRKFLEKKYELCPEEVFTDQIHDFLSLVEMELCSMSRVFIYSGASSWSRNVNQERQVLRKSILDVSNEKFYVAKQQ